VSTASAAANKVALNRIITAYAVGNLEPLLAALDADVVWTSHGPPDQLRFAGSHKGRDDCLAGLSSMATDFALHSYEIVELIAEGDVVWMQARVATSRRTGGPLHTINVANRWQFRDGKVVSITEYYDSASMLMNDGRLKATG
jgi:ketosteroid isomerase-like protein